MCYFTGSLQRGPVHVKMGDTTMQPDEAGERITIKTGRGAIEVERSRIVHFPEGIIGFEGYTDFVILDINDCPPFKSMLSVVEGGPDFVVIEPLSIFEDYAAMASSVPLRETGVDDPVDLVLLSIVTLSDKPDDVTVNLRGPIFLDIKTRRAKQVIIPDDRCRTKVPLLVRN